MYDELKLDYPPIPNVVDMGMPAYADSCRMAIALRPYKDFEEVRWELARFRRKREAMKKDMGIS